MNLADVPFTVPWYFALPIAVILCALILWALCWYAEKNAPDDPDDPEEKQLMTYSPRDIPPTVGHGHFDPYDQSDERRKAILEEQAGGRLVLGPHGIETARAMWASNMATLIYQVEDQALRRKLLDKLTQRP